MPFATYNNANLPAPLVEVRFKGLFIIDPNNTDGSCTVGTHRTADDHFFIIEVRAKRPDGSDVRVTIRPGLLQNVLTISADTPATGPRVSAFRPEGTNFSRKNSTDVRDLRWAIDLLHPTEFHGQNSLLMDRQAATPGIQMNDGIFITADITDSNDVTIKRTRGSDTKPLDRIATVTAALIRPQNGDVVLDWRGGEQPLRLPRPVGTDAGQDPSGTVYVVSVRNEPVAIDFMPTHDELERYYDLVNKAGGGKVPVNEQFRLEVTPRGIHTRNTDRIPCMPVILDGTS